MRTRISVSAHKLVYLAVGLALSYSFSGCGKSGSPPPPIHFVIFVDTTASTTEKQRAHWLRDAQKVIARMRHGDAITLYEISDRTLETKALFEAETQALDKDAGADRVVAANRHLAETKRGARKAIQDALVAPNLAKNTDLLSSIDRLKPDPRGRRLVIVYFTDALHSAGPGALNFERAPLEEGRYGDLIALAAKEHGWQKGRLAGAQAHFILPSLASGEPGGINKRQALHKWYGQLFEALGAQLLSFDTSFNAKISQEVNHEIQSEAFAHSN